MTTTKSFANGNGDSQPVPDAVPLWLRHQPELAMARASQQHWARLP